MSHRERAFSDICAYVSSGDGNRYERVLLESNGEDFGWLWKYGFDLSPEEESLAGRFFRYHQDKLESMAQRIVEAFFHGFISQSRNIAGRRIVRLRYQAGQEALARKVFKALVERNMIPSVQKPGSMKPQEGFPIPSDESDFHEWVSAYDEAFETNGDELRDTCGMIGLEQFGQVAAMPSATAASDEQRRLSARLINHIRSKEALYIPPSTISFCKVAFPNLAVGSSFDELLDDVMEMNLADSLPYELMQQKIIDSLDKCRMVRIKGRNGNETDLAVMLPAIPDSLTQSNFLNCGGDLNIPYGELFTTPQLSGTSGLYHVKEIYLAGMPYSNLKLWFEDGYIASFSCDEGEDYLKKNLFYPHETLTMGEFAIGTNMKAYQLAVKYDLIARLPIMWLEKMGPHIAVGDPCFSRAEEAPVFNLHDGKEMCARENERTARRREADVYYNKHIDITLPYGDIEFLSGFFCDGSRIDIIREGEFVLKGAEALNCQA